MSGTLCHLSGRCVNGQSNEIVATLSSAYLRRDVSLFESRFAGFT